MHVKEMAFPIPASPGHQGMLGHIRAALEDRLEDKYKKVYDRSYVVEPQRYFYLRQS